MANQYYSTVSDVIKYTGISYDKLGLSGKAEMETMVEGWLKQVASLINRDRGRNLLTDLAFGEKKIVDQGVEEWNEQTVEGVTVEMETDPDELPQYDDMIAVNRIGISSIVGANVIIASKAIEDDYQNLSDAKILIIKAKPYADCEKGAIQLLLSSSTACGTIIKTMDFPEMNDNEWKLCKFYLGSKATYASIKSIGLRLVSEVGGYFWVADIEKLTMPEGINNIAMRACANMVKLAYMNRESPVIKIDDWNTKLIEDQILTSSLKKELSLYYKKPDFTFGRVVGKIDDQRDLPISEID